MNIIIPICGIKKANNERIAGEPAAQKAIE